MQTEKICGAFGVELFAQKDIKKGIINSTKLITDRRGNQYILQEINNNVFKNIEKLMQNIASVSEYIHKMHKKSRKNIDTLQLLKTNTNAYYLVEKDENNKPHYFRMYKYIANANTYDEGNEQLLYAAGIGFGNFQKSLQNFPAKTLNETIYNFHNTPYRYKKLLAAVEKAKTTNPERYKKAQPAIKFAVQNSNIAPTITNALKNKALPIRVVHNDTKLNNVVLSNRKNKPVAVIDLDTVMPGSLLYDYGDAIRFCANTTSEDETNVKLIDVDMKKLKAFTSGFLKETHAILTENEFAIMPYAPKVLAYELGIRFLTDYLAGDKYFKVNSSRPDHNLERATAQFTLTQKFKQYENDIQQIISEEYKKY